MRYSSLWGFCPALYDDITPIIVPGIAQNSKKPNTTLKIVIIGILARLLYNTWQ
jgi:hypothetical protein